MLHTLFRMIHICENFVMTKLFGGVYLIMISGYFALLP